MRSITLALAFALSIAGAAWAQPAETPVRGRVVSVESGIVTVDTHQAMGVEPSALKVGDRVRIETLSPAPNADAPSSKRRLLGLSGLAVVGAVVVLRLRRPRTL
jgi:hypothetical protein